MKKFSLCAFADEAGESVNEQIDALNENEIEFLEVRGVDGKNISELTKPEVEDLKIRLDAGGIETWSIGSPIGKIEITDDFASQLELFKRVLETAQILNAKCIRLFSFYVKDGKYEEARDEVMRRLSSFCEEAKGSGVVLCHENEKGIYGDQFERCAEIHKTLPEIKAVFDPANFIQCGVDIKKAWNALSEYVYYLHIKDAAEDSNIVPAGHGIGEIAWILSQYEARNGEVLTIEPHLSVFKGLEGLEHGEQSVVGKYEYPNQRAAFDAAVLALKKLI